MQFHDLSLHPGILKAIDDAGYTLPTPIQLTAIPVILERKDLIATAQTGTGKTAAFVLPSLHLLTLPPKAKVLGPRILVLVPTRELAIQVAAEITRYSIHLNRVKTICIYGGAPYPIQNRDLSRPYEILVATPGRLIDHIERGRIDFSRTEMLILDEADRMLDMGFIDPVEEIAARLPEGRQTLMFSATLGPEIEKLTKRLLRNPERIEIAHAHEKHESIEQRLYHVDGLSHKNELLSHFLSDDEVNQAIVFTSTKRHADELLDQLSDLGHDVAALHGDMNQRQRTRTITQMRQGKIRVLVATDVAARGIDVQSISHVINFDLPRNAEDYVHRIGRTGRAGAKGIALSFASGKEMSLVRRIEQFTGHKMPLHTVAGLEPKQKPQGGGRPPFRNNREGGQSKHFSSKKPYPKREGSFNRNNDFKGPREPREPREPRTFREPKEFQPQAERSFKRDDSQPKRFYKKDNFKGPQDSRGFKRKAPKTYRDMPPKRAPQKGTPAGLKHFED